MKILFVTNHLRLGGIEMNLVRLTGEFTRRGHQVVAATGGGSLTPRFEAAGGHHHAVPLSLRPKGYLRSAEVLADVITRERPDAIHSFSAAGTAVLYSSLRKARGKGVPNPGFVSSIMGLKNAPNESSMITYARAYVTTLGVDKVIVISPAIAKVLNRLPISNRRLVSIPVVGVECCEKAADNPKVRSDLGLPGEGPVVMTIGRLDSSKSHELFIQSVPHVLDEVPDAIFVIVGDGPLRSLLQEEAIATGHRDRVFFTGEMIDGQRALGTADVYVRPGVVEGFVGITVLEAQAAGVPVVSFETEDVKLAIADGVTGLLVARGDPRSLAQAVVRLLRDESVSEAIARQARLQVEERFSTAAAVLGLEALYASVATSPYIDDLPGQR